MKLTLFFGYSFLTVGFVLLTAGCGVRQFNAQLPAAVSTTVTAYGPHFSSGQGTGAMATSHCGSVSGRPCARLKASVGVPFQFDVNSNKAKGLFTGTDYQTGPYTTQAGAGKTRVDPTKAGSVTSRRAPDFPRVENRDLHVIGQGSQEHRF